MVPAPLDMPPRGCLSPEDGEGEWRNFNTKPVKPLAKHLQGRKPSNRRTTVDKAIRVFYMAKGNLPIQASKGMAARLSFRSPLFEGRCAFSRSTGCNILCANFLKL